MRPSVRTVMVLALAVPLVAPALPASASGTSTFGAKGSFADVVFEGPGTPAGLRGNYTFAELSFHGGDSAAGYVTTYQCRQGQLPGGDEDGENGCDHTGSYYAWAEDVHVVSGHGKRAVTRYSGTVDLYAETDEGGDAAAENVPYEVALTATGRTSRSRFTDTYRDPESGESHRSRETLVTRRATVDGDLDGIPAVAGTVGTYTVRSWQRIR